MSSLPTVAMVNDVSSVGGGQQVMLDVADALVASDIRPVILSPPGWLADQAAGRGIEWRRVDFANRRMLTSRLGLPRPNAIASRRSDARRLEPLLTELGAHLVHTGALVPHLVSMFLPRRRRRLVWHVNQISPAALFAGRLPDRILGVSEAVLAPGRWRRALRQRSTVVPNAVDLDRFSPLDAEVRDAVRRSLGLASDASVVITVARLEPAKGVHRLIDIVGRCATKPALLVVGGPPPDPDPAYIEGLSTLAATVGCDLRLLGERDDVAALIGSADVFVFASGWEAFGLVLAEAAACGIPTVSGPSGGCREVVEDGVSGVFADPHDPDRFAQAVDDLISDPGWRRAMGRQARRVAEHRFDKVKYRHSVVRHYQALLAGVGE